MPFPPPGSLASRCWVRWAFVPLPAAAPGAAQSVCKPSEALHHLAGRGPQKFKSEGMVGAAMAGGAGEGARGGAAVGGLEAANASTTQNMFETAPSPPSSLQGPFDLGQKRAHRVCDLRLPSPRVVEGAGDHQVHPQGIRCPAPAGGGLFLPRCCRPGLPSRRSRRPGLCPRRPGLPRRGRDYPRPQLGYDFGPGHALVGAGLDKQEGVGRQVSEAGAQLVRREVTARARGGCVLCELAFWPVVGGWQGVGAGRPHVERHRRRLARQ